MFCLCDDSVEAGCFRRQYHHIRRELRFRRSVSLCLVLAVFYFGAHTETSDVDFEYPGNNDEANGFASLLTETRAGLDQLASRKGDSVPYVLSVRTSSLDFTPNDADDDHRPRSALFRTITRT